MQGAFSDVSVLIICWLLAAIFAVALRHKIVAWQRFKASFTAYRIVPEALVSVVAGLLVVTESVTLVALLWLQPLGLLLGGGLLAIYAAAIGINVARGRRQIDCGCGDEPTPVSLILVARNAVLICLAFTAYTLQPALQELTLWAAVVALSAALVAFGIYLAMEQLIANRGRHQRLWLGVS
jgi:hypothetical protein